MTDIERQRKLEADAIHDGLLRYAQSREYRLATDSKAGRDLLRRSLKPLADAILAEQLELKTAQRQKLPKYGVPLLSIHHEKLALITLGTLLNAIARSEYAEGLAPNATSVANAHPDVDLPDVPPMGDLDIRQVLASPYFFA